MKLMTKAILKALPSLYATDGIPADKKKVGVKFFSIASSHRFYAVEFDGKDQFFGYVSTGDPQYNELGYFSLSELEAIRWRGIPAIERDISWDNKTTLAEVMSGNRT